MTELSEGMDELDVAEASIKASLSSGQALSDYEKSMVPALLISFLLDGDSKADPDEMIEVISQYSDFYARLEDPADPSSPLVLGAHHPSGFITFTRYE